MGHVFSLILSREITDDESEVLRAAGCTAAVFAVDSLPTNASVSVTKMDFDDTTSPSLAEAIESALEAVKAVPDLTVPGLTVPAVVAPATEPSTESATEPGEVLEGVVVPEEPALRKTAARKPRTRKTVTAKSSPVAAPVGAATQSD